MCIRVRAYANLQSAKPVFTTTNSNTHRFIHSHTL